MCRALYALPAAQLLLGVARAALKDQLCEGGAYDGSALVVRSPETCDTMLNSVLSDFKSFDTLTYEQCSTVVQTGTTEESKMIVQLAVAWLAQSCCGGSDLSFQLCGVPFATPCAGPNDFRPGALVRHEKICVGAYETDEDDCTNSGGTWRWPTCTESMLGTSSDLPHCQATTFGQINYKTYVSGVIAQYCCRSATATQACGYMTTSPEFNPVCDDPADWDPSKFVMGVECGVTIPVALIATGKMLCEWTASDCQAIPVVPGLSNGATMRNTARFCCGSTMSSSFAVCEGATTGATTTCPVAPAAPGADVTDTVRGEMTLQVANPAQFAQDSAAKAAVQASIAALTGVDSTDVSAELSVARRLADADERRLSGGAKVAYTIAATGANAEHIPYMLKAGPSAYALKTIFNGQVGNNASVIVTAVTGISVAGQNRGTVSAAHHHDVVAAVATLGLSLLLQ